MIINIRVDRIYPHPDNPREDLGDLTELTESIKANGILQNLTVIPKNSHIPDWDEESQRYYAVIGHRRLAAAKMAGLEKVPCAIANMDYETQIATMLLENIQRSDLTIYEQAQGFQMMLDFGETVSDISEKTGFSETTVRRRTKLLELDQDKLKESADRGATLTDYAKLEKIKDTDLRNEVLETIGTNNFEWKLRRAIESEQSKKRMEPVIEQLKQWATEIEDETEYDVIFARGYHDTIEHTTIGKPDDADEVNYFYVVKSYGSIYLYREKTEAEKENEASKIENEAKRTAKRQSLERISKKAYHLRKEFICNVSNATAKKNVETIIGHLMKIWIHSYINIHPESIAELLNIKVPENETLEFDDIADDVQQQPEKHLLVGVYLTLDGVRESYLGFRGDYCKNRNLDQAYDLLETLGYKISDEELELKNGTHELFGGSD